MQFTLRKIVQLVLSLTLPYMHNKLHLTQNIPSLSVPSKLMFKIISYFPWAQ